MSMNLKEVSDFTAAYYKDGEFGTLTKADLMGKWSVFFFYPADFTYLCTTENEDLADKYEEFKSIGCEVYSVSCDTEFVHEAWHKSAPNIGKIKYPMVADPTHALSKDFDVYIEEYGMAERSTFIINPDGQIVSYEINNANIGRNVDEIFRKVKASMFVHENGDEVCPAKMTPSDESLKVSLDLGGQL